MPEEKGALMKAFERGLEELRAANSGQMAMDAPPIQPQPEPDYHEAVKASAALAQPQQDQEMSR